MADTPFKIIAARQTQRHKFANPAKNLQRASPEIKKLHILLQQPWRLHTAEVKAQRKENQINKTCGKNVKQKLLKQVWPKPNEKISPPLLKDLQTHAEVNNWNNLLPKTVARRSKSSHLKKPKSIIFTSSQKRRYVYARKRETSQTKSSVNVNSSLKKP